MPVLKTKAMTWLDCSAPDRRFQLIRADRLIGDGGLQLPPGRPTGAGQTLCYTRGELCTDTKVNQQPKEEMAE